MAIAIRVQSDCLKDIKKKCSRLRNFFCSLCWGNVLVCELYLFVTFILYKMYFQSNVGLLNSLLCNISAYLSCFITSNSDQNKKKNIFKLSLNCIFHLLYSKKQLFGIKYFVSYPSPNMSSMIVWTNG